MALRGILKISKSGKDGCGMKGRCQDAGETGRFLPAAAKLMRTGFMKRISMGGRKSDFFRENQSVSYSL